MNDDSYNELSFIILRGQVMANFSAKRKAAWEEMMKESIFEATVSVLKKHGVEGLRMDRVAREAEVATGTLYNYFKDKETLIIHVLYTLLNPFLNNLEAIHESQISPLEKLEAYFRETFRILHDQKALLRIIVNAQVYATQKNEEHKLKQHFRYETTRITQKIIEQGIREGLFRKCNTFLAANLMHGALIDLILTHIEGNYPSESLEDDVSQSLEIFCNGLMPA